MLKNIFSAIALSVAVTNFSIAQEDGFESMFNGENLLGWHINEKPESFSVDDGTIKVNGETAHIFYVGPTGYANFKNFHFKAKVKTLKGSNSGIYFHTKFQASGWPNTGYECQVNNTQSDPKKTGGLYAVKDNYDEVAKDDQWFDYEIMVRGKQITIKIDGKTITDYTEPADLNRPDRQLSSGTFALQAHDPGSTAYYKDLMIKSLDE